MSGLALALYHLGSNNIADTISNEDCRRHKTLFRFASHVGRSKSHSQADNWTEEANERITNNGDHRTVTPVGLPDDDEACNNWKTAKNQSWDTSVLVSRAEPAAERDADGAYCAQWKLEEDGLQ